MKKIAILVLVAALALALVGCASSRATSGSSTPYAAKTVSVTAADEGKSVSAAVGDNLDVALPGNPSTGYTWVAKTTPSFLKQEGEPTFTQGGSSGTVGAPGTLSIKFKATAAGSGDLVLDYKRPWETTTTPAKTFTTTVTVK